MPSDPSALAVALAPAPPGNDPERFRAMIERVLDVVTILGADGTILYESPSVHRLTGYSPAELVGRHAFDTVHPEDVPRVRAKLMNNLAKPGGRGSVEYRFARKDGSYVPIESMGTNLINDPNIRGVLVISRDLTERHRFEEEMQRAQKLRDLSRLAGGLAHDFNNLLAIMLGVAQQLASKPRDAELATGLEQIIAAGRRAADLTQKMRAFGRTQTLHLGVVDLSQMVLELEPLLSRMLGAGTDLVVKLEPALPRVRADASQLSQVLLNLVANGRDAMEGRGTLRIETFQVELTAEEAPGGEGLRAGPHAGVRVVDSGRGMTPEVRARLFEPFFTTKPAGEGTGLGLSTSYGIVRQSGGQIRASSVAGKGATFDVLLPALETGET